MPRMASEVLINIIVHINNTNTHHKAYTQPQNKQTTPKRPLILYNTPKKTTLNTYSSFIKALTAQSTIQPSTSRKRLHVNNSYEQTHQATVLTHHHPPLDNRMDHALDRLPSAATNPKPPDKGNSKRRFNNNNNPHT